MFTYEAYGLAVDSEFPLPDFIPRSAKDAAQVVLRRGDIFLPKKSLFLRSRRLMVHEGGILLYWRNTGAVLVREGRDVTVMPHPSVEGTGLMNALIVGAVMGTVLLQRGDNVLFHGAVIGKEDGTGAVAFLARGGGGKTSLATALLNRGYSLVSDDLLLVDRKDRQVQPGFPAMKIWKESAEHLVEGGADLPLIGREGGYEKRTRSLTDRFINRKLPLACLFLLEYGKVDQPTVRLLSEKEALAALMPHWYGSLFGGDLIPIFGKGRLFEECSFLARTARIYLMTRPRDLSRIEESADLADRIRREG